MYALWAKRLAPLFLCLSACSSTPPRFDTPAVDVDAAGLQAIELYDKNGDKKLDENELTACPGVKAKLKIYDANGDGAVDQAEMTTRLSGLVNRTGGSQLKATVLFNGRPLKDAKVVIEPEPYLGGEVSAAEGITNSAGLAKIGMPPERAPEHLRRFSIVHHGTFKVRITHPSVQLPAKYNTATELGYETEVGNPNVTFNLSGK